MIALPASDIVWYYAELDTGRTRIGAEDRAAIATAVGAMAADTTIATVVDKTDTVGGVVDIGIR